MGPNSFIFAYIFAEKCPRRGSTAPLREIQDPPLLITTYMSALLTLISWESSGCLAITLELSHLFNTEPFEQCAYPSHFQLPYGTTTFVTHFVRIEAAFIRCVSIAHFSVQVTTLLRFSISRITCQFRILSLFRMITCRLKLFRNGTTH